MTDAIAITASTVDARTRDGNALAPYSNGYTFSRDLRYGLNGQGWGGTVALVRATEALYPDAAGIWTKAASGAARINTTNGLMTEAAAINKVTVYNAPGVGSPTTGYGVTGTASVSVVDDATALAALVDSGICTYAIDMQGGGSGGTVTVTGAASAATHSMQCIARHVTGSGASFALGALGSTAISGTAYARYLSEGISAVGGEVVTFTIPAGVTIRVVLVGLEAGQACTTPIITSGATGTRNADAVSYNATGLVTLDELTIAVEYMPIGDLRTSRTVFDFGTATNRITIYLLNTAARPHRTLIASNGVTQATFASAATTPTLDAFHTIAVSARANDFRLYLDGAQEDSDTAGSMPLSLTTGYIGCAYTGTFNLGGWIRSLTVYPFAMAQGQMEQVTA
ncbi:MAG: LamG domain-containing protein [Gammaproteobacteria bacterium]|nr:LamG domain-containing protein [Gammaproteobacteria bacterium]